MNRYLRSKLIDRGEVRAFAPQDASAVADLRYRAFGYTFKGAEERAYDPAAIAAAAQAGGADGLVLALPDGRVAGYASLRPRGPGAFEVADALFDAEANRGDGVRRLLEAALAAARERGARKVVFAAPTFHLGIQRALEGLGFRPCYLALGEWPLGIGFRGGPEDEIATQRETRLHLGILSGGPRLAIYPPKGHADILRRLYGALGLEREALAAPDEPPPLPARGELDIELREGWQAARVRIRSPGDDTAAAIEAAIDDFTRGFLERVEARLPLDSPQAPRIASALERLGFVFCGVDPAAGGDEQAGGRDEAVYTHLLGLPLDIGRIDLAGEHAVALAAHIGDRLPRRPPGETAVLGLEAELARGRPARARDLPPALAPPPPLEMIEFARLAGAKQLVSGLAHEVNNPLNIILGATYMLRQQARLGRTDDLVARLSSIEVEVGRVARVLERLRRFAHPEAAPRARTGLAQAIEDALALMEGEVAAAGLELVRRLPEGLPTVRANAPELVQVFFQLLRNALDASQPGGEIAVEARADGDLLTATVRDRGRGIAPESLRRVFDPFYTTKEGAIGAGLGLSIARAIVETHGGRLRLESRPGEGTTAIVELPAATTPTPAPAVVIPESMPAASHGGKPLEMRS